MRIVEFKADESAQACTIAEQSLQNASKHEKITDAREVVSLTAQRDGLSVPDSPSPDKTGLRID